MIGLHQSRLIAYYSIWSCLIKPGVILNHPIMNGWLQSHRIVQNRSWSVRRLPDWSTRPPWTAQHHTVHSGLHRVLGLGTHALACAGPTCTLGHAHLHARMSVGPGCTTADLLWPAAGLHHLVRCATCSKLLSYVSSPSRFRLGCSWTCWTSFVVLDLAVSSIWIESRDIKFQHLVGGGDEEINEIAKVSGYANGF